MTTYRTLGFRTATGVKDNTGRNTGNWTVTFDPQTINVQLTQFECYKIVIHGAPGSTFTVYIDQAQWDTSQRGDINSWDPTQPMPLNHGQYLYFFWSDAITDNNPPTVTIWLRYDRDLKPGENL